MKKSSLQLKIALLSVCLVTASLNAITANIPEMANTFSDVPLYMVEIIATIASLFQMVGVLVGKPFAEKIGYKQSVLVGLLCCAIGGSIPLFIQSFVLILLTRCLFGLGCGLISSVMLTMIIHFFSGDERSQMIGLTGSVGGLGSAISSFTAGRLLTYGWDKSFAVYLLGFVVFFVVLTFVPKVKVEKRSVTKTNTVESGSRVKLIALAFTAFISTLLATFFIVKESTLITSTGLGSAQNGSFAITLISLGSLLAGAMYGKIYARYKEKSLVLFYIVSGLGLFTGFLSSLYLIYVGAFLIGWGLIAFTPFFQEKASRDFSYLGQTATNYILVAQALGAFAAPYYGNVLSMITTNLPTQFLITALLYFALAGVAVLKTSKAKQYDISIESV